MFTQLRGYRIIPTVENIDESTGLKIADALVEAGLPVLEVMYKSHDDAKVVRAIQQKYPNFIIGVGGILNTDLVLRAYDANAKFMTSPGFNAPAIKEALERNLEYAAGVCTPTDVMNTIMAGMTNLHFFPAQFMGGAEMLAELLKPFQHLNINVIVEGGVSEENMHSYLQMNSVVAVVCPWIVSEEDVEYRRWEQITEKAKKAKEFSTAKKVVYFNK